MPNKSLSGTPAAKPAAADRKRHPAVSALIGVYIVIRTIVVLYSVLFTVTASVLIYMGYKYYNARLLPYYNEYIMGPINEVKRLKTENPAESAYMSLWRAELRERGENDSLAWRFVPLDSISKTLINCVLAAEDDGFYTHPGISLDAIVEAIDHNRAANSIKRGASTITQQTAKNLFLTPEKSFERKALELGYTYLMEKYLGKDRILELYMNYAQWGKNIFGAEAAANAYYKKGSGALTLIESARMASSLAMPTRITPLHVNSIFMGKRITVIANNLHLRRKIDPAGYMALTGTYPPGIDPEEWMMMEEENRAPPARGAMPPVSPRGGAAAEPKRSMF